MKKIERWRYLLRKGKEYKLVDSEGLDRLDARSKLVLDGWKIEMEYENPECIERRQYIKSEKHKLTKEEMKIRMIRKYLASCGG